MMKRCVNRCLAFLLAFAMLLGNALPVGAAGVPDAAPPPVATESVVPVEETGAEDTVPSDTPEEPEPSVREGDVGAWEEETDPSRLEELVVPETDILLEDEASRGAGTGAAAFSEKFPIKWGELSAFKDSFVFIFTPKATGYYRLADDTAKYVYLEGCTNNASTLSVPSVPVYNKNTGKIDFYFELEKGIPYSFGGSKREGVEIPDDFTQGIIEWVESGSVPVYKDIKWNTEYTVKPGEVGYYSLYAYDLQGLFIGATSKNYILIDIDYPEDKGQKLTVEDTAETRGYDDWRWYPCFADEYGLFVIVLPDETTETRITYRQDLDSVFKEISQWEGSVTIEAGAKKSFKCNRLNMVGDYLIEKQEGLNFIPFEGKEISSLQIGDKSYEGFQNRGVWGSDRERRFILENTTEKEITVTLVTDRAFEREALQLGKNSNLTGKGPYFTFEAPENGIYRLDGRYGSYWMRKGQENAYLREYDGYVIKRGETVEMSLVPIENYEFAPEVVKIEAQPITEVPFYIPACEERVYYVFTPPRTGEYKCAPQSPTDYFYCACYFDETGWDGGMSAFFSRAYTLKEGEEYYFYVNGGYSPATISLSPLNKDFTAVKNWTAPITLKDRTVNYYSLTGAAAGDYLIKLSDDFELLTYETLDGAEYRKVRIGKEIYACVSFDGSKTASWKFSLQNQKPSEGAACPPVTVQPVTWMDLMEKISVGETKSVPQTGEFPSYYYYSFTPEETGIYEVQGDLRRACKKDGTALDTKAGDLLLLKGETCYLSLEGGNGKTLSITRDMSYRGLDEINKDDNTYTLESGQDYLFIPDKKGNATAFTSRLDPDEVTIQYNDGTGLKKWNYDEATGNYSLPMSAGTVYTLRVETTDGSSVKIGRPGDNFAAASVTLSAGSLKDEDLKGQGSASRMSASYKANGTNITASGTLKEVQNCLDYLGSDKNYKAGYFLALRLNTGKTKFKEDGYISITYRKDGVKQKKFYEYKDTETLKSSGYVDVILDMNEDLEEIQIRVGADSLASVKTYQLKLAGVVKEVPLQIGGIVSEAAVYGVKTSSPLITVDSKEKDITNVLYRSVAYSAKVGAPVSGIAGGSGSYAALKVAVPENMQNTDIRCDVKEAQGNASVPGLITELSQDKTYVLLIFAAGKDSAVFGKTLALTWSSAKSEGAANETGMVIQKIAIEKADNCYFETIPDGTELPKSIAINGLTTTMYVGQTQDMVTTITKKYENDKVCLSYSSSDNTVVYINRVTGEMEALKAGTAVITVEAVDGRADSKPLTKTAKITVKNPTAPASVKISEIKDTSVKVSWTKNATGQSITVYAVPYDETVMGAKAADWKAYIEKTLETVHKSGETLPEGWKSARTDQTSSENSVVVEGLKADTFYVFYAENQAKTTAGTTAAAGSASAKTATKKEIFDEAEIIALDGDGKEIQREGSDPGKYTVSGSAGLGKGGLPGSIGYKFYQKDADGKKTEMDTATTVYTGVGYKSTNEKVIKVSNKGVLTLGGEAGTAELYVTGKDAAGTVRETDRIAIEVIQVPTKLKAKTTTLAIGQSIALKELISYDGAKGAVSQIDTGNVDFETVWTQLAKTGSFKKEGSGSVTGDTVITVVDFLARNAKDEGISGSIAVDVTLKGEGNTDLDTKKATVKVNAMTAPAIKSVTAGDTSALITFTPNSTVRKPAGGDYYYTVTVTDMVTGRLVAEDARDGEKASNIGVAIREAEDSTDAKPVYTCEITGLSSNKKYRVSVKAHYDAAAKDGGEIIRNEKASGNKDVTTKKPLLSSEGDMAFRYISLPELKADPNGVTAERIEGGDKDKHIYLKNNETYVLLAEVSDLARILETDKLKWSISSGDKKAASIKASSSTFEVQLSTQRTGTFTVTAESTATKESLLTFTVTVDPFQSGDKTAGQRSEVPQAWLGSQEQAGLTEEDRR